MGRARPARGGTPAFALAEGAQFWQHQAIIESNGGRMLVGSGADIRAGIDSPEAIEAMQFVADMVRRDKSTLYTADPTARPAFVTGKLAMMINSTGRIGQLTTEARNPWSTASLPTFGAKPRRVPGGGNLLFIFAQDPLQQAAAWEWVKFLNAPGPLTQWDKAVGYLPTRQGLTDDPAFLKPYLDMTPALRPALDQLADVSPWTSWPGKNGLQATQVLIDTLGKIYDGGQDVAATLHNSAQQINMLVRS